MRHLSIRKRMTLILVAFLIPIGTLGYKLAESLNQAITVNDQELEGLLFEKPLLDMMNEVADYQVTTLKKDSGDKEAAKELEENAGKIDKLFDALAENYTKYGEHLELDAAGLAKHHQKIPTTDDLRKMWEQTKSSAYLAANYKQLMDGLLATIKALGNNSGMILDPELDSYSLVNVVINDLPSLLQQLGEVKSNGFDLLSKNNNQIPVEKRADLEGSLAGMKDFAVPTIKSDVETAIHEDAISLEISPTLKKNLEPALAKYLGQSDDVFKLLQTLIEGGTFDATKYVEVLDAMHDGSAELGDVVMPELKAILEGRIDRLKHDRLVSLGGALAVVVLALIGFYIIGNTIIRPVARIADILTEIADGNTDTHIDISTGKDEISLLGNAAERLRGNVEEAYMLKQMVDDMPTSVMAVDARNDFKINYINNASKITLKPIESLLPTKVEDMMGKSMDIFHKDPSHQRRMLADPSRLPHRAKIKLGVETLELLVSAIRNKKGDYVGAMLTWNIVTAKEKLADDFERDVKSVVNMVAAAATELSQTAESMSKSVHQSTQMANEASTASEQTTSNVQSVASATEELSASVREISAQLQKTNGLVQQSSERTANADKLAGELNAASDKVNDVMDLISSIAGQINLLALNATIESARAGDAGKGFAVVASEVKNLAGQTDKSITEIQTVVGEMRNASSAITRALSEIKDSISEISSATSNVASAVEEQSATTNEISKNMQTASTSTQLVSGNLTNVSHSSSSAASASEQMLAASKELSKQAETLNLQVDGFLEKVRAA